jgi:hypothetical protein
MTEEEKFLALTIDDLLEYKHTSNDWRHLHDRIYDLRKNLWDQNRYLKLELPKGFYVEDIPGSHLWAQMADVITCGSVEYKNRFTTGENRAQRAD